ncbi:MAG: hypothetical protein ACT4TC_08910 [Myxococcaceae bacterium]
MTKSQRRGNVAVQEVEVQAPGRGKTTELDSSSESPLFGVAMLKIAMELKKPDAAALDEILAGVLRRMNLSESAFNAYLRKNGGLLRAIASKRHPMD